MSESGIEWFATLPAAERRKLIAAEARKHGLSPGKLQALLHGNWEFTGRPKQHAPEGDWVYWWILAGRGFGKTLSAAQFVKKRVLQERLRVGLIAPIRGDIRTTMVEGESGLLSVLPTAALLGQSRDTAWNKTTLELKLANDSILTGFSSETPDRLRGPEHDLLWIEELSSLIDANQEPTKDHTTWSNAQMTIRASRRPQIVITSTPKPNKLTRALARIPAPTMRVVRGSSYENRANLSDIWWDQVITPILGTRTGRQEIEAELLEDVEGALWTRAQLETLRIPMRPGWQHDDAERREMGRQMRRIVVSVDPNTTSGEAANDAGIIVCGQRYSDGHGIVLDDRTQTRGGPAAWARAAVDAFYDWEADLIVVEVNNGGEMCKLVIQGVDPGVTVRMITASRGKRTRAEPVAALYTIDEEREVFGFVHHAGAYPELEDEMTMWTPEDESPNRMDALVWGMTELKLPEAPAPAYRRGQGLTKGRIPTAADRFGGTSF